jgi:hypothetical protein
VRVEAQPEGEFSYRGAVAAYRSGYPEDQIHDALPTARRRRKRGPRGSRQQAVEYLQRPLTGGRPQGRALAGPVVKTRGDRDDHPDMLVRGEPDDQLGVVALRAAAGSGTPISAGNCAALRWAGSSPSAQRTCVGIRPACPT